MANWIRIASIEQCPPGSAREFVAEQQVVAVFNVAGTLYALDGICPHQGGPLGEGTLQGCVVTCPWHGWQFDVRTGQHQTSASLRHARFPVKVVDDEILVDLQSEG